MLVEICYWLLAFWTYIFLLLVYKLDVAVVIRFLVGFVIALGTFISVLGGRGHTSLFF